MHFKTKQTNHKLTELKQRFTKMYSSLNTKPRLITAESKHVQTVHKRSKQDLIIRGIHIKHTLVCTLHIIHINQPP